MIKDKQTKPEAPILPNSTVFGAVRVDPRPYKASWNETIWERTKYAIAGSLYMLRRERSIRNVMMSCVLVLGLASWLQIDLAHVAILVLAFGLLWSVETLNSAIEAVVDMVTQEYHPMAKVAKDVAASATLVASLTAFFLSLALVGVPLLERFV